MKKPCCGWIGDNLFGHFHDCSLNPHGPGQCTQCGARRGQEHYETCGSNDEYFPVAGYPHGLAYKPPAPTPVDSPAQTVDSAFSYIAARMKALNLKGDTGEGPPS